MAVKICNIYSEIQFPIYKMRIIVLHCILSAITIITIYLFLINCPEHSIWYVITALYMFQQEITTLVLKKSLRE